MQNYSDKSLPALCDMLVEKTVLLLKAIEQKKPDGIELRDLKIEVEQIQAAIKDKRSHMDS